MADDSGISGKTKIVPKEVVEARNLARQIISAAKNEADEILTEAHNRAFGITRQAYDDGIDSGLSEVTGKIVSAHRYCLQVERNLENQMVSLAVAVARKIIRCELSVHPDTILEMICSAVGQVRSQRLEPIH